jgi:hypothetical protein
LLTLARDRGRPGGCTPQLRFRPRKNLGDGGWDHAGDILEPQPRQRIQPEIVQPREFAGQTVTLKFTGTEDLSSQTSFVIDDTAANVS